MTLSLPSGKAINLAAVTYAERAVWVEIPHAGERHERTGVIVRAAMSRLISSDAKRMEQVTDFAGQAAFKLQTPKYIGKIVTGENLKTIPRGS